ncbi:MAG TPA: M20 family metallopeptidase [Ktedonobacteraceae bacterium]|nr:M20 family metallopeptidase [Ktedonobacteraceae bacterium]
MDLPFLVREVEEYTQQRLPQYIEELRELCAIDSDSYNKAGLDEMAARLGKRMSGLGMDVKIIEREKWGNDLLGVLRGTGQGNILLLGHIDTVYPPGTAAARPLRVEGDTVYGPGVCDMKGCVLAAIYAIEALQAADFHDYGELRFLCVSDEEINTRHCQDVMQQVCEDCQTALVLEAARANGDIVSARKGNTAYTLTVQGRSAHAGVEPEKGRNAIVEMAHQVLEFQLLNGWREGLSISAGVISGGTVPNVVPDFAQTQFDIRFLKQNDMLATEELFRESMRRNLVPDVELTLEHAPDVKGPMVRTPESLKLAEQAREIAHLLGFSVNHVLTGGSSDASYTSSYGVPSLDGLGPIGGRDHSPYEYLELHSVAPRAAMLAGLIASAGQVFQ